MSNDATDKTVDDGKQDDLTENGPVENGEPAATETETYIVYVDGDGEQHRIPRSEYHTKFESGAR